MKKFLGLTLTSCIFIGLAMGILFGIVAPTEWSVALRKDPISDVDVTHKASYLGMLTDAAGRLEQKLKWDPKREECASNTEANRLLPRPKQNGWQLEL
jgi:hypothetical protein